MFNYMLRKTEQREEELKAGAAPDSFASAMAGIDEGMTHVRNAARWIEAHGDMLRDDDRSTLTAMRRSERELSRLSSALKSAIEGMASFHEREPEQQDESDEG